ncbi:hypothetical protein LOK49_LG07G02202 [Camellia lanceoleosa]|uniref:Uncharacterized protein n=1 Tax=Camellia lanceoleosa TaxID=1840588 RepID=A0ACC0H108_9ERIC|nr:hypothetical protein LOK49_LG07G02202 [Camellia lanceoleosa]
MRRLKILKCHYCFEVFTLIPPIFIFFFCPNLSLWQQIQQQAATQQHTCESSSLPALVHFRRCVASVQF